MNIEEIRNYCLNCINKPCSNKGCPLNNDIPSFIHEENIEKAYEILSRTTVLPAICGTICPHEKQCMGSCIRGIKGSPVSIGDMEAFIGREAIKNDYKLGPINIKEESDNDEINKDNNEKNNRQTNQEDDKINITKYSKVNDLKNKSVAVIGGGPAGLTCAAFLARVGVKVTIYEKYDKLGGILVHGIPDFRLDKKIVESTINKILELGINVKFNQRLGDNLNLEYLTKMYDAVFISIGANIPAKMGIEGEDLKGVYGGNLLLESGNHPNYKGKKVAVIGGGNVAMDTSRTIKRLGAKDVYVIYRRAEEQMPAERKEIEDAKNEGIEFLFQTNIVKILGKEAVKKIECIKTKLVQKEGETRLSPVNIEGSNYLLGMDYVIMATGSKAEEKDITEFEKDKWGYIKVDENMETSIPNVFAGGDIIGRKSYCRLGC